MEKQKRAEAPKPARHHPAAIQAASAALQTQADLEAIAGATPIHPPVIVPQNQTVTSSVQPRVTSRTTETGSKGKRAEPAA